MADFVKPTPVSDLFESTDQLIIPRFQRKYEWSSVEPDGQIPILWDDIVHACEDGRDHYIGAIVIMPDSTGTGLRKNYLIDGQQRWTTLSILFRALYDYIEKTGDTNYPNICRRFIVAEDYGGTHKLKRLTDGDDYARLIDSMGSGGHYSPRKTCSERCFQYFSSKLDEIKKNPTESLNLEKLFNTLRKNIKIVMITVSDEDPCVVFESLNSKGKNLTSMSMIRNYVMLKCASLNLEDEDFQDDIYNNYWLPFEKLADNETKLGEYLRVHLMMSGERVTKTDMYRFVKKKIDDTTHGANSIEGMKSAISSIIMPWINDYSSYRVVIGEKVFEKTGKDAKSINQSIMMINRCGFKSPRNYILKLLCKNRSGQLSNNDLAALLRIVESYIVRRTLYRNLLNNTVDTLFLGLCLGDVVDPKDVYDRISCESGAGIWPNDDELRDSLEHKDFYSEERRDFCISVLTRIDTHLGNGIESIESDKTNEHIFPQTPDKEWREYCSDDYHYMAEHVHRLGNITILDRSHNSENSNDLYDKKKDVYLNSRYVITNTIPTDYGGWNRESFLARQKKMIEEIQSVWPRDYDGLKK